MPQNLKQKIIRKMDIHEPGLDSALHLALSHSLQYHIVFSCLHLPSWFTDRSLVFTHTRPPGGTLKTFFHLCSPLVGVDIHITELIREHGFEMMASPNSENSEDYAG